jgi:hypothetical protein
MFPPQKPVLLRLENRSNPQYDRFDESVMAAPARRQAEWGRHGFAVEKLTAGRVRNTKGSDSVQVVIFKMKLSSRSDNVTAHGDIIIGYY